MLAGAVGTLGAVVSQAFFCQSGGLKCCRSLIGEISTIVGPIIKSYPVIVFGPIINFHSVLYKSGNRIWKGNIC
jgi:hypothetical protein